MSQSYDCIALIGRFSPFDNGHLAMIERAQSMAARVIVVVTAADVARSGRHPFVVADREVMVRAAAGEGVDIVRVYEHAYDDDAWLYNINALVPPDAAVMAVAGDLTPERMARLTHTVLESGEAALRHDAFLGAFYSDGFDGLKTAVPPEVFDWMTAFRETGVFSAMAEERRYTLDYRQSWTAAPYPVVFVTVDTLIIHADPEGMPHVLLIRRGRIPGKGQWALPGGFVEPGERLRAAALRELREETRLGGTDEDLARLVAVQVFDDPGRSARGHVITHAHHFEFTAGPLPHIAGGDDAEHAQWLPLRDLPALRDQFFEDHGSMIEFFLDAETC